MASRHSCASPKASAPTPAIITGRSTSSTTSARVSPSSCSDHSSDRLPPKTSPPSSGPRRSVPLVMPLR
eukprot:6951265-Pyramimonas_sp.AAC.1